MFQLCDVSPKITGDGRPDRQFSPLNGTYGVLKLVTIHKTANSSHAVRRGVKSIIEKM
jgi:hypothetical protein